MMIGLPASIVSVFTRQAKMVLCSGQWVDSDQDHWMYFWSYGYFEFTYKYTAAVGHSKNSFNSAITTCIYFSNNSLFKNRIITIIP